MEDLEASLALSFSVSSEPNSTSAIHPRFNNYKNKNRATESQDDRRKKALESFKSKRDEFMNNLRNITDCEDNSSGKHYMRCGNHLMHSEWMVEVPQDLVENYSFVLSYVGKRYLVVASRGKTRCYDKAGHFVVEFPSALSGGNRDNRTGSTVLDCIYDENTKTYYVLDMLSFDKSHIHDCSTEFRWYWNETKFKEEMQNATVRSQRNPCIFTIAPRFQCTYQSFVQVFSQPSEPEIDGLLIYNMELPYVFGTSPVTTWLKPYMIPEVMGVDVHHSYMTKVPSWYTGFSAHLENVENIKKAAVEKKHQRIEMLKERKLMKKEAKRKAREENERSMEYTESVDYIEDADCN